MQNKWSFFFVTSLCSPQYASSMYTRKKEFFTVLSLFEVYCIFCLCFSFAILTIPRVNVNTDKLKLFLWLFRFNMRYINRTWIKGLELTSFSNSLLSYVFLWFSLLKASVERTESDSLTLKSFCRASPWKKGNVELVTHRQWRKRNILFAFHRKGNYIKVRQHFKLCLRRL